ncbi:lysozyme inhibitor LprI family protein [Legionella genomosp. 1]|uniref:lysozyme inhibitor LprI family protein n=1 Tax=Legionella genomosp. 1 TaxID=1093625 RepID=UPI0013EF8D61|nr:lysozyme inhibitor LprI family protein [Legionella genomosp. 1]
MKRIVCMMLMLLMTSAFAETQSEMTEDACQQYKAMDTSLNSIYKRILQGYQDDKAFIASFVTAQKKWLAFRDAHLDSLYPNEADNGSVSSMCRCNALYQLTKARVDQLKLWDEGVEEGDVCSGTIKSR